MARILHVTEAYGGGVVTSIRSFVENSNSHQHYLLASHRENDGVTTLSEPGFAAVYLLPEGLSAAIFEISRAYRKINPDFVHLHSSFAGVYGRLALIPRNKIIYSPHCFSFEKTDSSGLFRLFYRFIENVFSMRTGKYAAVSNFEAKTANQFIGSSLIHTVPNTWSEFDLASAKSKRNDRCYSDQIKKTVAFVGRLAAQKDPLFLVEAIDLNPDLTKVFDFKWYGGGDDYLKSMLEDRGVFVSDWVPHQQVLYGLADSDLYVHVAAWEGFPMSVIEAAAIGVPIALRRINAFNDYGFPENSFFTTPADLVELLDVFLNCNVKDDLNPWGLCCASIKQLFSPVAQRKQLCLVYSGFNG